MIDLKTLAQLEHHAISNNRDDYAEAFRLAMRYLALREDGIYFSTCLPLSLHGESLDASADRIIQERIKEITEEILK